MPSLSEKCWVRSAGYCVFTYLQSVEKCGFAGSIQAKDQNAHLLRAEEALEIAHQPTHFVRGIFPGLLRDKLEMSMRQGLVALW